MNDEPAESGKKDRFRRLFHARRNSFWLLFCIMAFVSGIKLRILDDEASPKLLLMCVVRDDFNHFVVWDRHTFDCLGIRSDRGFNVEFQAQVLALISFVIARRFSVMLGLVDTLTSWVECWLVGLSVQFHRSDLSNCAIEISRLSEQGKSAFRSQDLERYAGYSSLRQSLSRCEWEERVRCMKVFAGVDSWLRVGWLFWVFGLLA